MEFRSRNMHSNSGTSAKGNTDYPAIAKIIGRGKVRTEDKQQIQSIYYGSGVYVAEQNNYGIVLTNWHVVSDSDLSIQVVFNNFTSEGIVLLADEIWDLAAIIIHKPPFLPVPISLEVPQIGEDLWVAGYGQFPGLQGFEMQKGKVLRYMILGEREGLPAETVSISVGVRKGDSGGPILNQYGELSGLLWGSDGVVTMGTFSLRLQAFLTQAQYQLFNQPLSVSEFFTRKSSPNPIKMIQMASTPAQTALKACGIFPISTQPIYTTTQQNSSTAAVFPGANQNIPVTTASVANQQKPPYPPVESPTLIAQRKVIGREHPEVYPQNMLDRQPKTIQLAKNPSHKTEKPAVAAPKRSVPSPFVNVSLTQNNTDEPQNIPAVAMPNTLPTSSEQSPVLSPSPTPNSPSSPSNSPSPTPNEEISNPLASFKLGDIQTIVAIIIIFFLFFNAVRLLSIASEK